MFLLPYQELNLGQPRFRAKDVIKVLRSFLFAKPAAYYIKVLECIIDICGVNYFQIVAHAQATPFRKKKLFLILTIIFILRNNRQK